MAAQTLLIATTNPGKRAEYAEIYAHLPVHLLDLRDVGLAAFDLDEPYETFAENAVHKARTYAQMSGMAALADDSGLCVDALGGRPGVYSARYAATPEARIERLLEELAGMMGAARTASFVCVTALAYPTADGEWATTAATGAVYGQIADAPASDGHGFGYDPVFVPEGYDRTFGQLPASIKHTLSHRGRAAVALLPALYGWLMQADSAPPAGS